MKLDPTLVLIAGILPFSCFNPEPATEDGGSSGVADSGSSGVDTVTVDDSGTREPSATEGDSTGDPGDPCDPDPCENGGTCMAQGDAAECACPPGYGGEFCEEDPCDPSPCANDGTCSIGDEGAVCECVPGFEGDLCETETDDCAPNPCVNMGMCTDIGDGFECACPSGFEGDTCETNIDDCMPNPCMNGGACIDGIDDFSCNCMPPFEGDLCQCAVSPTQQIDYTSMGTFLAGLLYNAPVTVTGSNVINVLNLNGLGIVGGVSDNTVDGAEFIEFTFDAPSIMTSYFVSSAGNQNGDGFVGSAFIEAFDETDASLGVVPVNGVGTFDLDALLGGPGIMISRFVVTANVDSFRVSSLSVRTVVCN